jgi:hypothetical protein
VTVRVQIIWADGRAEAVELSGGLAPDLIMPVPVPNSGGGWRPEVFRAEVLDFPHGWHGPFESEFWLDGDTGRFKMIRYRHGRYRRGPG